MLINQTESGYVDSVLQQVIWVKSGDDDDYCIPARPVYSCLNDMIIAQTLNLIDPTKVFG